MGLWTPIGNISKLYLPSAQWVGEHQLGTLRSCIPPAPNGSANTNWEHFKAVSPQPPKGRWTPIGNISKLYPPSAQWVGGHQLGTFQSCIHNGFRWFGEHAAAENFSKLHSPLSQMHQKCRCISNTSFHIVSLSHWVTIKLSTMSECLSSYIKTCDCIHRLKRLTCSDILKFQHKSLVSGLYISWLQYLLTSVMIRNV